MWSRFDQIEEWGTNSGKVNLFIQTPADTTTKLAEPPESRMRSRRDTAITQITIAPSLESTQML